MNLAVPFYTCFACDGCGTAHFGAMLEKYREIAVEPTHGEFLSQVVVVFPRRPLRLLLLVVSASNSVSRVL